MFQVPYYITIGLERRPYLFTRRRTLSVCVCVCHLLLVLHTIIIPQPLAAWSVPTIPIIASIYNLDMHLNLAVHLFAFSITMIFFIYPLYGCVN